MIRTLERSCGRPRVSYDSEALPGLGVGSVTNRDIDHYYGKQ
jgi:hypothetical protein